MSRIVEGILAAVRVALPRAAPGDEEGGNRAAVLLPSFEDDMDLGGRTLLVEYAAGVSGRAQPNSSALPKLPAFASPRTRVAVTKPTLA